MCEPQNYTVDDGINYEYIYIKAKDDSKPTLLFLHGFPSLFYCWHYRIEYFSKKEYDCLAPNLMGYSKTYAPLDTNEYKTKSMAQYLITFLHESICQYQNKDNKIIHKCIIEGMQPKLNWYRSTMGNID
ncbi:unnamed protein product [Rotaria sordida]|uniref:AB hydrolase-1 domain-containing protein n=1 Tax=Rotaria sordida TaxID=392033 RepID=A0A813ZDB0_9BILA|nr:unnamed protein product [Rotaria sordida]CAF3870635.1 unnamed protein product [Rotaria sordida]